MINIPIVKTDLRLFIINNSITTKDNLSIDSLFPKYTENFKDCIEYSLLNDVSDTSYYLFMKIYTGNIMNISKNKINDNYNKQLIKDAFRAIIHSLNTFKFMELEKLVDSTTYSILQSHLNSIDPYRYRNINMGKLAYLINDRIINFNTITEFDSRCMCSLKCALKKSGYNLNTDVDDNGIIYASIDNFDNIYNSN